VLHRAVGLTRRGRLLHYGGKFNCLACHTSDSYATNTQIKLDFLHAAPTKTWTVALAHTDSDGDGTPPRPGWIAEL
jgi:hypothetical protein